MFFHFETQQERLVHTQIHVDMIIPEYITRYFHEVITQEKLGVGFEVFGNGNKEDLHWSFVHELHVGPLTHGKDRFSCGHTIVHDENFSSGSVSTTYIQIFLDSCEGDILFLLNAHDPG